MTDFLGNLILRSTGDPSPHSILQPRLPSLFEPIGGEIEMPLPDPVVQDPIERDSGPSDSAPSINELPMNRSTIAVEPDGRERMSISLEREVPPDPAHVAHPGSQEAQPDVLRPEPPAAQTPLKIRAAQVTVPREGPQQTIMPRVAGRAARKEWPGMEASIPEELARPIEQPASTKKGPAPLVLQPVLAAPRPASVQPFEQKEDQAPQQVVEIHIGRIEVRAAPPSAPKRASQKPATMSLEEYLRSRPGERP